LISAGSVQADETGVVVSQSVNFDAPPAGAYSIFAVQDDEQDVRTLPSFKQALTKSPYAVSSR
jgi:hypothetical protein